MKRAPVRAAEGGKVFKHRIAVNALERALIIPLARCQ
jgi:hypothetical protein